MEVTWWSGLNNHSTRLQHIFWERINRSLSCVVKLTVIFYLITNRWAVRWHRACSSTWTPAVKSETSGHDGDLKHLLCLWVLGKGHIKATKWDTSKLPLTLKYIPWIVKFSLPEPRLSIIAFIGFNMRNHPSCVIWSVDLHRGGNSVPSLFPSGTTCWTLSFITVYTLKTHWQHI